MTPAAATRLQQSIWNERGDILGVDVAVDDCPYTSLELSNLEKVGRRAAYLPEQVATQTDRHLLAKIFPACSSFTLLMGNAVTNDASPFGWFDYDAQIVAPSGGLDKPEVEAVLRRRHRSIINLNQYVVASHDSRLLTGQYLDERSSWTRVGSRLDGRMLAARFDGLEVAEGVAEGFGQEKPVEGSLLVAYDLVEDDKHTALGVRSVGFAAGSTPAFAEPRADAKPLRVQVRPRSVEAERERQLTRFLQQRFHTSLGLSEREYRESFPEIGEQPKEFRDRFSLPLLVDPRIPWELLASLADIALSAGTQQTGYEPATAFAAERSEPYAAWFSDWDERFPDSIEPAAALAELRDDEAPGNLYEVIAMDVAYPAHTRNGHFWDVIGAKKPRSASGMAHDDERDRFACMYYWRSHAEIGANLHPMAYSIFRPLVRGRSVRELSH